VDLNLETLKREIESLIGITRAARGGSRNWKKPWLITGKRWN